MFGQYAQRFYLFEFESLDIRYIEMIDPPENHKELPDNVTKHYWMQYAEMIGKVILHDEYAAMAYWMISKIHFDSNEDFIF